MLLRMVATMATGDSFSNLKKSLDTVSSANMWSTDTSTRASIAILRLVLLVTRMNLLITERWAMRRELHGCIASRSTLEKTI